MKYKGEYPLRNRQVRYMFSTALSILLTFSQTTDFRLFQTERVATISKLMKVAESSPTMFSKDLCSRHVKNRACLGKGKGADSLRNKDEFKYEFFPFDHKYFTTSTVPSF